MTGLLKAIRLDHQIMRARYPMLLILLAIGIANGAISETPTVGILLVTLISAPIGGSYFAMVESGRLDLLYGTLPLKPSAVSAGIYAYSILAVALNGLLAVLIAWWIALAQHVDLSGGAIATTFTLALLGACVYIGLLYPVYLVVPFSKVNVLSNVPVYVVAVVVVYAAKRTDWLDGLRPVGDFFHRQPGWASLLTVGVGVSVLVLSWSVAQAVAAAARRR
jgi:ABC-2 family transporter protein